MIGEKRGNNEIEALANGICLNLGDFVRILVLLGGVICCLSNCSSQSDTFMIVNQHCPDYCLLMN